MRNCVKYIVEGQVIVIDISKRVLLFIMIFIRRNWAPDGSCFNLCSDTVHH